ILSFDYITITVLILAILIKVWQTFFNMYVGKKINSMTLIATGTDSRNDVIATSAVLIGVIITKFTGLQLDGWLGSLVALFIIWSGITLIKETSSPLLGEAPDEDMVSEIEKMASAPGGVIGIHDLVVHNYGPGKVFASIHIEVDADEDIMKSHDMVDNIEREIGETLGIHCVAHMDPIKRNDPAVKKVEPVITETIKSFPGVTGMHDLRVVPGPTHTNIIFDLVLDHECKTEEKEIKGKVQDELQKIDPCYFVVITFDRSYTQNSI
ncbi:MAG TPA: cation diffusion facilitator family transporter, partial [Bacillota bacterium]|nr:cation diffusion facilitator family transporter [Bacillota bacterium]